MSETGLVQIIEGALLAAGKPMTVAQIAALFEEHEKPENKAIREALAEVAQRCEGRGFELQEVSSGFRFQVRQSLSTWVGRLWTERAPKYSRALLETLALIAYRQPITRGEIEEIRGVAVSSNIVRTLHEREWIRVVGHRDVPGRPAMYATTKLFLDYFNLKSLDQLPALAEIRDLETLNAELGFTEPVPGTEAASEGDAEAGAEVGEVSAAGSESVHATEDALHDEGAESGELVESAVSAVSNDAQTTPGLTVVGGTEHKPDAESESGSEPEAQADSAQAPSDDKEMSLADVADALEARMGEHDGHEQSRSDDTEGLDTDGSASGNPESQA